MVRPTSSSSVATSAVPVITEGEIRAALGCVLASRDFDVPERVGRFLSFVIEEALAGRAERIKAYVIAVEVFGRRADIDVMNDPVVRIEAARLRREALLPA
jgi:adenylate cyclase